MNAVRVPDFVTSGEAQALTDWVLRNHDKPHFLDADMGGSRKTTRYKLEANFDYPAEALAIRQRVVKLLGEPETEKFGVRPPFKDGIVASYAPPGDTCYEHKDPEWAVGFHTLHCNVLSQAPEGGGVVIIEGGQHEMRERELFCYLVSRDRHEITEVLGSKARCMWVFCFCITDDDWESLCEKHQ
jgi:hypothetical protein